MKSLSTQRDAIRKVSLMALNKAVVQAAGFKARSKKITIGDLFEERSGTEIQGWVLTELFDAVQGVTWGGANCKDIFVVDSGVASNLESKLVYRTIGGKNIRPYEIKWDRKFLVFPYIQAKSKWVPAFRNASLGGADVLDFSVQLSNYERGKDEQAILDYRIAKNIVDFPNTAKYLAKSYSKLAGREFEGKNMSEYNKGWYEYHRPRNRAGAKLIGKPKIVCKRLMKSPAFALDTIGYLPSDSVLTMCPKEKLKELKKALEKTLGHKLTVKQVLSYVLAFLNSGMFQDLLDEKRSKKRGGYPIVSERLLRKFTVPRPSKKHAKSIEKTLRGKASTVDLREMCVQIKKRQTNLS